MIGQEPEDKGTSEEGHYKQIFRLRALHLLAAFTLIYVGIEVTLGGTPFPNIYPPPPSLTRSLTGWIVTYVIKVRDGGPSAGYISSGFFGGLALGRVCLLWLNTLVGERLVIFFYIAAAIG
jgi:fucose permease